MSNRRDRGRSIANYITRATGIPLIEYQHGGVTAPSPYQFKLVTDMKWSRFQDGLPIDPDSLTAAIRYDKHIPNVPNAIIGMRLQSFVPLLRAHGAEISAVRPFSRKD